MQTQKKVSVALTFSLDVNNLVVAGNILYSRPCRSLVKRDGRTTMSTYCWSPGRPSVLVTWARRSTDKGSPSR